MTILYCIALFASWLLMTAMLRHDIIKGTKQTMALQDDLNAAVAQLKSKDDAIIALVTTLNATVTSLQAQVSQNRTQIDPTVVQAAVDALNAESVRVAAALAPPTTAPVGQSSAGSGS